MRYSLLFFCLIACCSVVIPLKGQDTLKLDTIPLNPQVQQNFTELAGQMEELEDTRKKLAYQIALIAQSHGIKPEEIIGWTADKKSILKKKK